MGVQKLKNQGNYLEDQLYSIIVNSKGQPDLLAINLYCDIKSWYKPNKCGKSKLKSNGYKTSYEELAKKYNRSKGLIKQKIVFLESLGLLSRDFRIEYIWGKRENNVMYLLLWKETPYFEFEFGIDRTVTYPANLDKKTWYFVQDSPDNSITTPRQKIEGAPVKNTTRDSSEVLHFIYSNTTLNTTINNTDLSDLCSSEDSSLCIEGKDQKNQDSNFVSSNQEELEGNSLDDRIARAKAQSDQERLALPKQQEPTEIKQTKPDVNSELLEFARQEMLQAKKQQSDTHTRNGNVYHGNKLLNEFEFTDDVIDAIREKSDKPHFSNGRITAVMRNIVAKNPNLRIWGGRQAFINYMVKAINNEKEFTKEEKAQSLAEMKKKEAEQVMYDYQHRVIRYF
jgi:hypothetical protein